MDLYGIRHKTDFFAVCKIISHCLGDSSNRFALTSCRKQNSKRRKYHFHGKRKHFEVVLKIPNDCTGLNLGDGCNVAQIFNWWLASQKSSISPTKSGSGTES